ncbi:hypothetical protein HO133_004813 [Letharia lupina]|uniref:hydroxymethylglutaryl-CoA lyase n=1 Tax=Letharia lupina TaxID=560253 RepID=A0A8H6FKZ7_9LECA|nr:uncharacterized protein HO133_004813 [Letharia lupina]KAF6230470.1 hypothetical protein HO133_004813 [Letharia lupina]
MQRRTGEVRIVEVGPRDGLQNESTSIPLETKIELIRRLAQTGVRDIEAGSFVAPKWVPQMANSSEVLNYLLGHPPAAPAPIAFNFLVPNLKGLQNFLKVSDADNAPITSSEDPNKMPTTPPLLKPDENGETGEQGPMISTEDPNKMSSDTSGKDNSVQPNKSSAFSNSMEVSLFTAATEEFSKKNTNCTIAESLERCRPIVSLAKSRNIRVRGYVSVALGCPYEGPDVPPAKVAEITATLLEMGADEVSVADTTGMGTAPKTQELLKALFGAGISAKDLALHFHDTYGQALVNAVVGLEQGIRTFDSSVGGLGGCPYSKGATGNVATEDLLHCLHSLGAITGVDVEKVAEIGDWISKELGRPNDSRAGKAYLARLSS